MTTKNTETYEHKIIRQEMIAIAALVLILSGAMVALYVWDRQTGVIMDIAERLYSWIVR